jgi:hypothetical protein
MLSSMHYLLKPRREGFSGSPNFFYSGLSVALATGTKASNIPLGLPWLIAVFVLRAQVLKLRPIVLVGALLLAGSVSAVPTVLLNIYYTGTYSGDRYHETDLELYNPMGGLVGNGVLLAIYNLRPPVWPTQVPLSDILPKTVGDYLAHAYPRISYVPYAIDEIQMEESGGVGVGIMACVFLMIGLRWWAGTARPGLVTRLDRKFLPVLIGTWVAVFVLMAKLGNEGFARMLTPYYPLLIAGVLVLVSLDGAVIRLFICRIFAGFAIGLALILIIISPARPLFPVNWAVYAMGKTFPSRVERVQRVYGVYGSRYDAMKEVRVLLPDSEKTVGFLQTGDVMEATLWRPYGVRRILDVAPELTLDQLRSSGIHLVVVGEYALNNKYKMTIEALTKQWSAQIIARRKPILRATADTGVWYILELPR